MRISRVVGWCLVVLLSVVFLGAGVTKFTAPGWEARFAAWGYPAWMRVALGTLEIVSAALLWVPRTRQAAALLLVVVMIGAALTHLVHGEAPRVVVNATLAAMLMTLYALSRRAAEPRANSS